MFLGWGTLPVAQSGSQLHKPLLAWSNTFSTAAQRECRGVFLLLHESCLELIPVKVDFIHQARSKGAREGLTHSALQQMAF